MMDITILDLPFMDSKIEESTCAGMLGQPQLGLVRTRTYFFVVTVMQSFFNHFELGLKLFKVVHVWFWSIPKNMGL